MIVLVVSEYFPALGGTSTQTKLHAHALRSRGWDVRVVTRRLRTNLRSECVEGTPVRRLGVPGDGRVAKAIFIVSIFVWLRRRAWRIRAVGTMLDPDYAITSVAAGLRTHTVVTWVTAGDASRDLVGPVGVVRRFLLATCKHVVLTEAMKAELDGLRVRGATVIPVPVDTRRFQSPTAEERAVRRKALGLTDHAVVLFVGHLEQRKAVDLLLIAFRDLLATAPEAKLLIVGGLARERDESFRDQLQDFVDSEGLAESVAFMGPQEDVVPFLHASDIFCLPSHREGMPNAILEAMACQLACVAPASAGGGDLLAGGCGVVPPSNQPDDLRRALAYLVASPALRQRLAVAAYCLVRTRHDPVVIAEQYEVLWD